MLDNIITLLSIVISEEERPGGVRRRKQFWVRNVLVEKVQYGHYDNLTVDLL